MKTRQTLIILMLTLGLAPVLTGQTRFSTAAITTVVAGTSTLHDWEMKKIGRAHV